MANFKTMSGGKTIQEAFNDFHKENPEVFLQIAKQADRAFRLGKKKFSVKQIIEYVRWEVFLETKETDLFAKKGETKHFKINNCYASRYARLLAEKYPHLADRIEMREIRSI